MTDHQLPRLSDRELEIMKLLWEHGQMSAGEIASHFLKVRGQFRNSTYTFITKLIEKGVVHREDPGYICIPLYEKDTILVNEAHSFLDKVYDGSFNSMFAQFVRSKVLTPQEITELQKLIDESTKGGRKDDHASK